MKRESRENMMMRYFHSFSLSKHFYKMCCWVVCQTHKWRGQNDRNLVIVHCISSTRLMSVCASIIFVTICTRSIVESGSNNKNHLAIVVAPFVIEKL